MGVLGLSGVRTSAANTKVAWASSDTTGFHNGQRENRTWSYSTLRFLIVVQLLGKPQPTEWERVDQIDAAFILARADFVNVHR
jgi:hypothetical protein